MPSVAELTDIEILEELDFHEDDFLPCNYGNGLCKEQATWTIQCPECGNTEPNCTKHDAEMKNTWDPETPIQFDCGHVAALMDCPRKPL